MGLCLNIDCNSGLEFHGEVILENRDLRDQALDQYLVKLRDRGGLAFDEILQVLDQVHLLILDHTVDLGLFSHIPESKNLVSDGVVRNSVLLLRLGIRFLLPKRVYTKRQA